MQIGELAKRFDLNPKTIRYYEAIGLLPEPGRSASGYRQYDDAAIARLGFIQRAKRLGLSLAEIRDILAAQEQGEQPCDRVLTLIDAEIARITQRIIELDAFRAELTGLRERWSDAATRRNNAACVCPIIEEQPAMDAFPPLACRRGPLGRRGTRVFA